MVRAVTAAALRSPSSADDAASRHIDASDGTPEWRWAQCSRLQALPEMSAGALVPEGGRVVVVAPHPDDEILAAGGLLSLVTALGRPAVLVAVTDGTASHPGSTRWPAGRLHAERPQESLAALTALGVQPQALIRLGLPDGGLREAEDDLARQLQPLLHPSDVVVTTWRLDGHPDHEATGRATVQAAAAAGARCLEAAVWAWHWAQPGDERLPWNRAFRLLLPAAVVQRKQAAMAAFASQIQPDPSTGAPPVLRQSTLARAGRPFEVFFDAAP